MNTLTHKDIAIRFIGESGTTERLAFENKLKAEILTSQYKELREEKNLTQAQLAEKTGIEKKADFADRKH